MIENGKLFPNTLTTKMSKDLFSCNMPYITYMYLASPEVNSIPIY